MMSTNRYKVYLSLIHKDGAYDRPAELELDAYTAADAMTQARVLYLNYPKSIVTRIEPVEKGLVMNTKVTENELTRIWGYVFAKTMRERAAIPGFASDPANRFTVAVANADEAVATDKAAQSWLGVSDEH